MIIFAAIKAVPATSSQIHHVPRTLQCTRSGRQFLQIQVVNILHIRAIIRKRRESAGNGFTRSAENPGWQKPPPVPPPFSTSQSAPAARTKAGSCRFQFCFTGKLSAAEQNPRSWPLFRSPCWGGAALNLFQWWAGPGCDRQRYLRRYSFLSAGNWSRI